VAPGAASKGTAVVTTYEWPPWLPDLDPTVAGDQPGWGIHAPNPSGGADHTAERAQMRVHVAPGLDHDGSRRRVLGVHFLGPPGAPLAADSASVSPSSAAWTATRHPDDQGYSFASSTGDVPMPETGLVFRFGIRRSVLESASWRSGKILLTNDAGTTKPGPAASSIVGAMYWARSVGEPVPGKHPISLPFAAD
jgi:hypothetical protein